MNLYDNLKYFARILNVPSENIDLLLKRIGLYEHRKKMVGKPRRKKTASHFGKSDPSPSESTLSG